MNCQNCGAPLALIRDGDYFFCEYCLSFHFPEEQDDRVIVLGEESSLKCPHCKIQLVSVSIGRFAKAVHCSKCKGVLVPQQAFGNTVQYLRSVASGPPDMPKPLDEADLNRQFHCPSCHKRMSTHPYYGPGNVVIDVCVDCGLVWLDHGELDRIINYPGRDRGARFKEPEELPVEKKKKRKKGLWFD